MNKCDHKFIDSVVCLKCGWHPSDVVITADGAIDRGSSADLRAQIEALQTENEKLKAEHHKAVCGWMDVTKCLREQQQRDYQCWNETIDERNQSQAKLAQIEALPRYDWRWKPDDVEFVTVIGGEWVKWSDLQQVISTPR